MKENYYETLAQLGYTPVMARYKDANHNRQGWQYVFSRGEHDYVIFSRKGGDPEELAIVRRASSLPSEFKFKYESYDSPHDLLKERNSAKSEAIFKYFNLNKGE